MRSKCVRWLLAALCGLVCGAAVPAGAQPSDDKVVLDAQDAQRRHDRGRLAALRDAAIAQQHPLASWVDYWEIGNRLGEASMDEIEAFYARWRGTYVEDRLRNDWLLELGRRKDWPDFRTDFPRFRMNDDRQVTCYALLTEHLAGKDVREIARSEWFAQRDADDGCHELASTLVADRRLTHDDVWQKLRLAIEYGRPRAARLAATLLDPTVGSAINDVVDRPARYLTHKASTRNRTQAELAALAIGRMAASDPEVAAGQLAERWQRQLPNDLAAWAWGVTAKQSALKLLPEAHKQFQRAFALARKAHPPIEWSDDLRAWQVRAALRAVDAADRWQTVRAAIDAMGASERKEPAWIYWKARAQLELAAQDPDAKADELRLQGRTALRSIASPLHFYGQLAAEDLGLKLALPSRVDAAEAAASAVVVPAASQPAAVVAASAPAAGAAEAAASASEAPSAVIPTAYVPEPPKEAASAVAEASAPAASAPSADDPFEAVRSHPGLARALHLIALGLRSEGVREWNFALRGMTDRELLAAAQWACEREVWDRCINTSDRTKREIDVAQRYPTPFREALEGQARDAGVDPAYVFGLVRQESRFMVDARSAVGASGLMQLMPSTARWVAGKIGLPYKRELIGDRDVNLRIGTAYLKLVLDSFEGSQAMAAAAYNAGPARPRRWREGPLLETPIWAESIPFPETRDYVKKVLANAHVYATLLGAAVSPSLKARLGPGVGPRAASLPAPDPSLP